MAARNFLQPLLEKRTEDPVKKRRASFLQPPSEPERESGGFLDELGSDDIKQKIAEAAFAETMREFGATGRVTPSMPTRLPAKTQPVKPESLLGEEMGKRLEAGAWQSVRTGEVITHEEKKKRYPKGYEAGLDEWVLSEEGRKELGTSIGVFGKALTKVPRQTAAAVLQATQGQGGASVVDRDWADRFISDAQTDIDKFVKETEEKQGESTAPIKLTDLARLPQNIAFSITSMGAGLGVGVPTALVPLPGARVAAWVAGSAASGAVAYSMTTYQIMQTYLELMNESKKIELGLEGEPVRGLNQVEENELKKDFEEKARRYGLWEAVPEAISNLAFARLLTLPLGKMVGKNIASQILQKLVGMYGQELLTETITQKGQAGVEAEVGLRGDVTWGEAFKEIAPQTFLLTTILGGAGQIGISSYNKIKSSLKKEVGTDHPRYKEILEQAQRWVDGTSAEGPMIPPSVQAVQAGRAELAPPTEGEAAQYADYQGMESAAGLRETLAGSPAANFTYLVKKTGKMKGEFPNLTLKQYRDITGKTEIKPNILTPDKKHVRWEYALDEIATEQGYPDGDAFRDAIMQAWESQQALKGVPVPPVATAQFGEADAGLQASMLSGVPDKEVRIAGKGIVTQAKMDDFAKLQQYKAELTPPAGEVKPPTAIEIRTWRDMGLTPKDIAELKTMSPELRELTTHQARLTGFRDVSNEAIDDYLQKSLALANKLGDAKAIKSINLAIKFQQSGELQDAILESEKGLGYIHQSSGEAQEHIAEMGRLQPVTRAIGDVLKFPETPTPPTPVTPEVTPTAPETGVTAPEVSGRMNPFPSPDNPKLEGFALFDPEKGLIIPQDVISKADEAISQSEVFAGGEGHDALMMAKSMLAGDEESILGSFGEIPRIRFDTSKNIFTIRYDEDGFLRSKEGIELTQASYRNILDSTTRYLRIAYPNIGISIPETGEFIPATTIAPTIAVTLPPPVSEGIPPTAKVNEIQKRGKVAPKSVKPQDAKYAHIEKAAPDGPRPPKPPKPPAKGVAPGKEPSDILKEITDKATLGERADQTLLRLHEAARGSLTRRTNITIQEGNKKLKDLGIGVVRSGHLVPTEADKPALLELYNALHNPSKVESGEIAVPAGYEDVYQELRGLADWDTASRLDFDPQAAVLEDWFFRGWKPPEGMFGEAQKGRLVTKPRALRMPRVNATFNEMIEAGFEPLFWNPYQQWGYRHNMGEVYREQMELVSYLKGMGDELIRPDAGGTLPAGWRIPRVGPAFEGKPFSANDSEGKPTVMFTRRWAVTDSVANSLENIYGTRPDMGKVIIGGKTVDPLKIIDAMTFFPKRAKLFASLFQQVDFLTRSGAGAWTGLVDNLMAGKPIEAVKSLAKFPQTAWTILESNFNPETRLSLSKQMDDTTPLIAGRPGINMKGIGEAGLSTMDVTIFPEDMDKLAHQVAGRTGVLKKIPQAIADLESAMRRGLFQGVYPAAIMTDVRNNIAPIIARQYPDMTDAQINGMIARIANIKYSTIPASQSVFQNRFMRETLRRVFFSVGESEGLLRQATGATKGPYASYWRKHWIGVYLFLIVTANLIHWASTGEPLPKERYSPISKDEWGPLPFGYNTKFASPTLPFRGRGDTELTIDLAGQMDTAFRILNPGFFLSSRTSVPIRATVNQVSGTDFYGAPIDDVGPGGVVSRTAQLITDLFSPIGIGGITTEVLRQNVPGAKEVITEGESRLGMTGLGVQATGVNIRGETTGLLLDRYAKESGFLKASGAPVQRWSELEPSQKDEVLRNAKLVEELSLRGKTSVERGYPGSAGYATRESLDKERIDRGEALVTEFDSEQLDASTFRDEVTKLKTEISAKKSQVDEDFQLFQDTQELPDDPNKRALVEYYAIFDKAKRESKSIDWDKVDQMEEQLRQSWTPEQEAYVDRNIGLTEWGPKMQEYIKAQDVLNESGYWDIEEPDQYEKRMRLRSSNPEVEAILQKWYGYKPPQPPKVKTPYEPYKPKQSYKDILGGAEPTDKYTPTPKKQGFRELLGVR